MGGGGREASWAVPALGGLGHPRRRPLIGLQETRWAPGAPLPTSHRQASAQVRPLPGPPVSSEAVWERHPPAVPRATTSGTSLLPGGQTGLRGGRGLVSGGLLWGP